MSQLKTSVVLAALAIGVGACASHDAKPAASPQASAPATQPAASAQMASTPAPVVKSASGVTGKWTSEFDSQVGHQKYVYDLKADGDKLTGKAHRDVEGDVHDTDLTEGKIDGNKVSFVEILKTNDQELRIEYHGTISGDELKLTRAVGDFATTDIVAKRATP